MRTVLFIGDSIMYGVEAKFLNGYGFYVREALRRKAEVILPLDNCQDTRFTNSLLGELFEPGEPERADLIYWNNGLWDVLRFSGNPTPMVPIERYTSLLCSIYGKLRRMSPQAKIVFATSTPIIEDRYPKGLYRLNSDIREYNSAAKKLFEDKDVTVHDLYSVAESFPLEYRSDDATHFSELGAKKLSEHVLAEIGRVLGEW